MINFLLCMAWSALCSHYFYVLCQGVELNKHFQSQWEQCPSTALVFVSLTHFSLCLVSIPLETLKFSDVFTGYRHGTLASNGLIGLRVFFFFLLLFNLSCRDPGWREKINLNFYVPTSLWCLERFYKGL